MGVYEYLYVFLGFWVSVEAYGFLGIYGYLGVA